MRRLLPAAAILFFTACGNEELASEPPLKTDWTCLTWDEGRMKGILSGVHIEIDSEVRAAMTMISGVNFSKLDVETARAVGSGTNISINEARLDIRDGEFHIGERSYGLVKAGDKVHISTSGVKINENPAGDLPPPPKPR